MSGICIKFSVGAAGKGGARVRYDTKERATEGEHKRVWTQNVPEYVDRKEVEVSARVTPEIEGKETKTKEVPYKERRENLIEFARQRDEDEQERSHEGSGETRTWYRAIYSFHDQATDEKAIEMVSEHQQENFPKCTIINSLHRNAEHLHVHSIIFARQTDDKKLQLGWKSYREIDESWAKIYGREFGEHFAREHLEKKEERRKHRAEARLAKLEGRELPPRPKRVSHERNQLEEKKKISLREHGVVLNESARVGGTQRPVTGTDRELTDAAQERVFTGGRRRERPLDRGDRGPSIEAGRDGEAEDRTARDFNDERIGEAERAPATRARPRARQRDARDGRKADSRGGAQSRSREGADAVGGRGREDSPVESRDAGRGLEGAGTGGIQTDAGGAREQQQSLDAGGAGGAQSRPIGSRELADPNPATGIPEQFPSHPAGRDVGQPGLQAGLLANDHGGDRNSGISVLHSELDRQLDDATEPYRARLLEEERAKNTQSEQVITGMEHEGRLEHEPERVVEQVIEWTMDR